MPEPVAGTTVVDWERAAAGSVAEPLVRALPYVELTLEHPTLDATSVGESFFPAAVPYELDEEHRVFYWQPSLPPDTPASQAWGGVCATPTALRPVPPDTRIAPQLVEECERGSELVVDGTVAGESTTAVAETYDPPDVVLGRLSPSAVELELPGRTERVRQGSRAVFELPTRDVSLADSSAPVSTTPELVVRFPGSRTLYHPAPGAEYHLFPSFGLDVDDLARPVSVPTRTGELDHLALAEQFGLDLSTRPYPERVLWQAFAFTAFDPHRTTTPRLTQFDSGGIAVR